MPTSDGAARPFRRPPTESMKDYVIGFVLSVVLTAIPFWLVMAQGRSPIPGWVA